MPATTNEIMEQFNSDLNNNLFETLENVYNEYIKGAVSKWEILDTVPVFLNTRKNFLVIFKIFHKQKLENFYTKKKIFIIASSIISFDEMPLLSGYFLSLHAIYLY